MRGKSAEPQKIHLICLWLYCQGFEPRSLTIRSLSFASLVIPLWQPRKTVAFPLGKKQAAKNTSHWPVSFSQCGGISDFVLMADFVSWFCSFDYRDLAKNVRVMAGDYHCERRMVLAPCSPGLWTMGQGYVTSSSTHRSLREIACLLSTLSAAQLSPCNVTTILSFFFLCFFLSQDPWKQSVFFLFSRPKKIPQNKSQINGEQQFKGFVL